MSKSIMVPIEPELRDYIEKLHFESLAIKNVLRYIMLSATKIDKSYILEYQNRAENKQLELDFALSELSKTYKPQEITGFYTYEVEFDRCAIRYDFNKEV